MSKSHRHTPVPPMSIDRWGRYLEARMDFIKYLLSTKQSAEQIYKELSIDRVTVSLLIDAAKTEEE